MIMLYKGAGVDHILNMKLLFNSASRKRKRLIAIFVCKAWEIGGILFYT